MTLVDRSWTGTDPNSPNGPDGGQQQAQGRQQPQQQANVGDSERAVSVAAGAIVALMGLGRRDLAGLAIAAVGGGLIYRGATGHCPLYNALGMDTAHDEAKPEDYAEHGIHVSQSFLIDKSPQELYAYWRDFRNLPRIMTYLERVDVIDEKRSHWVAKAPAIAGGKVEWDAELIADEPNARIAWRSLPGADVDNAGSVVFTPAPGDRGTAIQVVMDYLPPAGRLGKWLVTLLGQNPKRQIREDLRNFKRVMEVGEVPTLIGQPHGTCRGQGETYTESEWKPLFT